MAAALHLFHHVRLVPRAELQAVARRNSPVLSGKLEIKHDGRTAMKIIAVETWLTQVPFDIGAKPTAFGGIPWQSLTTLWVRVVTDAGLEGWGEGFGHACCPATRAAMDTQVGPAAIGEDARDIAGLYRRFAERFHLFGRNGPHVYALSALDTALWDIAGKAAGLPLWRLLGATPAATRTAYASLLRYPDPAQLGQACERAIADGYRD